MDSSFSFLIKKISFNENYNPSATTRTTTNFANLARGDNRQQNLRNTLKMINNRFNSLACWDNPAADRYRVEIDIISAEMTISDKTTITTLPLIEFLQTHIVDTQTNKRFAGIVGNNLSSYVRDYDFSILLSEHNKGGTCFTTPNDYGLLHGKLFKAFLNSAAYKENFNKQPVICLSVSSSKVYRRTSNTHPVLGIEYQQDDYSLTDAYFSKMGLRVRYFMPAGCVAPLAFYFSGDLLNDYTPLELIGTISTMDTFQKIYRPEIYNANACAGEIYQPSLSHQDYSLTRIVYDREERSQLAVEQGRFVEEQFIKPYKNILEQWSVQCAL